MMQYENVYTVAEENSHSFYQLPKELFVNKRYKNLSVNAKLTYAFLLDRKELSRKNNWVDEYGQVFLLFTRENVGDLLNLSNKTVIKAFKELRGVGLIFEERQGLNKPNKIFVGRIKYERVKTTPQEMKKIHPNYTEFKETEKKLWGRKETRFSSLLSRFEKIKHEPVYQNIENVPWFGECIEMYTSYFGDLNNQELTCLKVLAFDYEIESLYEAIYKTGEQDNVKSPIGFIAKFLEDITFWRDDLQIKY